jgi:hypothetical protein
MDDGARSCRAGNTGWCHYPTTSARARGAETGGRIDAGVSELELKVTILRPMDSTQAAKQL